MEFRYSDPEALRLGHARKILAYIIGTLMLGFFAYGLLMFPDNPIHPCKGHGYCGKQGQLHSQSEFDAFSRWDAVMAWWPVGIVAIALLQGARLVRTQNKH